MTDYDPFVTPVVVLGMGPTALAMVRALGRRKVPVYGVGLNKFEVALSSRYCIKLGVADPRYEPRQLLKILLDFGRVNLGSKLLLYPTGDECIVFIATYHRELSGFYTFSKMNKDVAELFLNKELFFDVCVKHGLQAPATYKIRVPADIERIASQIGYPCILKPKYYHLWAMTEGLTKAIFCNDQTELLRAAERQGDRIRDFIVQRVVEGPEDGIFVVALYIDQEGKEHGTFVGQKIRQYPVGFGTTTMMKTAHSSTIEEIAIRFLKDIGYTGLADVEFKYDEEDRIFRIIEINPRVARWYGIVEAAGVDTIYYSYLDLTGQPICERPSNPRPQLAWVFAMRDIPSIIRNKKWHGMSAIQSYKGPKTWCIWAKDDIKPFFAYFAEVATKIINLFRAGRQLSRSCLY